MAIGYDNSTHSDSTSFSHTTGSGSNRGLVCGFYDESGSQASGITYNSVALTKIGSEVAAANSNFIVELWYLPNPASGANTLTITGGSPREVEVATYTGIQQTTTVDATGANDINNGTPHNNTVITTVDNCWHMATCFSSTNVITSITGGTVRGSLGDHGYADDLVASAGSNTIAFNRSASDGFSISFGASFAPAAIVGPVNVKTFQGVASASVKTLQGVAIANVKSSQGVI